MASLKEQRDGFRKGIRKEQQDGLRKGIPKLSEIKKNLKALHEYCIRESEEVKAHKQQMTKAGLLWQIAINIEWELKVEYLSQCPPAVVAHLKYQHGRRKGSFKVTKVAKLSFADARSMAFDGGGAELVAQVERAWFRECRECPPGVASVAWLQELFDRVMNMLKRFWYYGELPTELGGSDTPLAEQVLLAKQLVQDVPVRDVASYKVVKVVAQGFVDRLYQLRQQHGQDKLLYD